MLARLRVIPPVVAIAEAVAGGVYFGLFSCGGYGWHQDLFWIVFLSSLAFVMLVPPRALRGASKRLGFTTAAVAAFLIIRGAASAFYPAPPESWGEFGADTWIGIWYGPCG